MRRKLPGVVVMHRFAVCLSSASVLAGTALAAPPEIPEGTDARAAALFRDYYSAYAENDYDRMASFYADDAVFEDPTSDIFLRGKAKLRETMNALDAYRNLHWRFHQIVRQGDVVAGQASITGEANGTPFATRFATMMTLKDGKIVRHIDYVDNRPPFAALAGKASDKLIDGRALDDVAGKARGKSKKGEARKIADAYLEAIDRIDAGAAERLYAEDAVFEDPTFRLFMRGRETISAYARAAFPNYQYVRFAPETIIASGDSAVIEGTGFGVADGHQAPMRFMTFLRVTDGKITSHADFYDYGDYERLARARDLTRDTKAATDACKADAFQKLAFWVGSWKATAPGGTAAGKNRIERVAGGCAVLEHWDGLYLVDMKRHFARGLHWYDPSMKAWRHVWIDDAGGPLEMVARGGEGPGLIYAPVKEPDPKKRTRMTIRPMEDGRVEQFGETSSDYGRTWKETFRLFYARAE
jgi:ketosteroid isomerase-like protein